MKARREKIITLHQGDCLEYLPKILDNSIDLTITSPPYDNLRNYNGNNSLWGEHVWKPVLSELYRITKIGGVVVWVVGDATVKGSETGTSFRQSIWAMECGFNLYDTMIYQKHGMPTDPRLRYYQRFEYMFIFSLGRPIDYTPIADVKSSNRKQSNGSDRRGDKLICTKKRYTTPKYSVRGNIWEYDCRNMKTGHPASFPLDLVEDHIISWSKEGATVFDPFMGSGTTGIACKNLKRKFIGIELDEEYFESAKNRIDRA